MANSSIKLTDIPVASNISINSKLLAVDFDTEKTELITTRNLLVYLSNTVSYRDQVNAAYDLANSAYLTANAVYLQTLEMYEVANTIYLSANASYETINVLYNTVNSAYIQANNSYAMSNQSYDIANSAYAKANVVLDLANGLYTLFNTANNAYDQANNAYDEANTKLSLSGGTVSGNVVFQSSVLIEHDLTVTGNVTTISANNLVLQDNMIYINDGAANNANPDLGVVGAYNDGIYRHTGIFRDATDGYWKVFDQYEPEPDESIYIDTSNNTFRLANFQANNIYANVSASNITSGTISTERLGSGTANANTYLAGDNVWKPIVSGATLTVDESSNTVYYIGLSDSTSEAWLTAYISPNKFVFNPALGRLGINVAEPNTSLHIAGNDAIIIPSGTDSDRPDIPVNGMLRYNTSNNYIESYSNNSWAQVGSGAGSGDLIYPVREQFVAIENQTIFVVDGGYVVGELDVFYNGIKLRSGTEVNVSSGEYFSLTTPAANNALIEVIGFGSYTSYGRELSTPRREFFTANANQTSFTITGGYSPGMIDVYYNGSKLVNGQDIDVSSGLTIDLTDPASNGAIVDVVVLDALSYLDAVKKTGDIMTGNLTAVEFIGGGSGIVNIDANNISSGTVNTARLGTGEANSNTYLAGDASWKSIVGFSSTDDTSSNTTYYPVIATTAGGSTAKTSSSKLYYNPSTGTLSATIFNSLSDENLKKNIINIPNGLEIIEKIDAVEFEWIDSDKKSFGVIAQQLEQVVPELVTTDKNKTVNYNGIIAFLIKSVQELSDKIKELETK